MPRGNREERKAALEAAYDHVHTDMKLLEESCTAEHAIVNMGQTVDDHVGLYGGPDPARLFVRAWSQFLGQAEGDEMADGMQEERQSWIKDVRRDIKLVQRAKLPLTVRNVRAAFLHEGPFARKEAV